MPKLTSVLTALVLTGSLALTACQSDETAPETASLDWSADAAPGEAPPMDIRVTPSLELAERGERLRFDIALPEPLDDIRTWLVFTTDGLGDGSCPPELRGECLDIVGEPMVIGPQWTLGGQASFTLVVPEDFPTDAIAVQAVASVDRRFGISSPGIVPVAPVDTEICDSGADDDGDALIDCDDPDCADDWACTPDCLGVIGGEAVEDMCGVCDADPTNDCALDCEGIWGGDATEDMCGVCDADPTNDCALDCEGIWGGAARLDGCGVCDDDPTNDCSFTCSEDYETNQVTGEDQYDVVVADDPSGGFAVVWKSLEGPTTIAKARFFDASGAARTVEVPVDAAEVGGDHLLAAVLTNGSLVVAWNSGTDTYFQILDTTGVPVLDSPARVTGAEDASIRRDGDGFELTYHDNMAIAPAVYDVFAHRFSAEGASLGSTRMNNRSCDNNFFLYGSGAELPGGHVVRTWFWDSDEDDGCIDAGRALQAECDRAVSGLTSDITVHVPGTGVKPRLQAINELGDFVLAWKQSGTAYARLGNCSESGLIFPGDGSAITLATDLGSSEISLAGHPDGFLLTYSAVDPRGDGEDAFMQTFDASALAVSSPTRIGDQFDGDQAEVSVANLADGGFVTAWASNHGGRADTDVFTRAFESSFCADPVPCFIDTCDVDLEICDIDPVADASVCIP